MSSQFDITPTHLLLIAFVFILFYLGYQCQEGEKKYDGFNNTSVELRQSNIINNIKERIDSIARY
jgi:hypothetical protein